MRTPSPRSPSPRTPLLRSLPVAVAALLALAGPARADAQAALLPGSWSYFEWFSGLGPVEGDGFTFDALAPVRLRFTDGGVTGDAFDIFINGVLFGATPGVPGGIFTDALDGDAAWGDPRLSKAELRLDPGSYLITLELRESSAGFE